MPPLRTASTAADFRLRNDGQHNLTVRFVRVIKCDQPDSSPRRQGTAAYRSYTSPQMAPDGSDEDLTRQS